MKLSPPLSICTSVRLCSLGMAQEVTPFCVFAMRYIPIRDQHLTILARIRDACRARAERLSVEDLIRACVPGAATCNPGTVADAIRFDSFDYGIPAWQQSF